MTGTSIFDPVLCEMAYRWFCPLNGIVIDPFAGGSVRGIVASKLGRQYIGIDLRQEQIEANRNQAKNICRDPFPVWYVGNSMDIDKILGGVKANFLFSCPPYADLEKYSEDPMDLSNMEYGEFLAAYRMIISKSLEILENDSFACFVVGEVRDKKGNYYGFVPDTIQAFRDAGAEYYNEMVLVTMVGSLPIRVGKMFVSSRKIGKTHQNVLVFCKGDARKATAKIGDVEFDVATLEGDGRTFAQISEERG